MLDMYWHDMLQVSYYMVPCKADWLQSLKQFFINVPYNILVASISLMALYQSKTSYKHM